MGILTTAEGTLMNLGQKAHTSLNEDIVSCKGSVYKMTSPSLLDAYMPY